MVNNSYAAYYFVGYTCEFYKCILKVWGIGFLVDIFGSLLLLATLFLDFNDFLSEYLIGALTWNPFSSPLALIYDIIIVSICSYLIYLMNYHFNILLIYKNAARISSCVFTIPLAFSSTQNN